MAGITVISLANGRLKCNLTGYSNTYTSICPYIVDLRFRKLIDGKIIDVVYLDGTIFQICSHNDSPLPGVIPVETINSVDMTDQTLLYDTLAAL